jgi:riboflavin kinase/FMN adenylyltransferase
MRPSSGSVVTIGAYDGVHLGHRRVIAEVCRLADEEGLESVVVTFDRHPASVVRPESAPLQLTDLPQRLELLKATGISEVRVIEFTPERAAETAEEFVEEVLVGDLLARIVVVGSDFHFGKGRGGNVALLEAIGAEQGFRVLPFGLVGDAAGGPPVSSTGIRRLVAGGELEEAARLLGRPHEVRGLVVAGEDAQMGVGNGRAEDGQSGVTVEIPGNIVLPPPGSYRAEVGSVGAADVVLESCRVVVGARGGEAAGSSLAVLGLQAAPPGGTPLRVLFTSNPSA